MPQHPIYERHSAQISSASVNITLVSVRKELTGSALYGF